MSSDEVVAELSRRSGRALVRLAYQLTHDAAAAEDVVQEALARMLSSWRRTQPHVANLDGYARRAVVNEYLRRQRRRETTELVVESPPDSGVPDDHARVDDRAMLWAALGRLSPGQRAVLVLRYYEDLPDERIAELLGIRRPTVRSLASRALGVLRVSDLATEGLPRGD